MAEKDTTANTPNFYTELIFLAMAKTELSITPNNQKRRPTRTLAIKMDFGE
jgi:hypothetical protein